MTFYETLDSIMKQDFGGRGLLASLPASPLAAVSASLALASTIQLTDTGIHPGSGVGGQPHPFVSHKEFYFRIAIFANSTFASCASRPISYSGFRKIR